MLKEFYPYEYKDSVFDIDFKALYSKGYRGLIFDIDNTLVPHGANSTDKVDELFGTLKEMGFKSLMLSNNSEKRILRFLKNIDAQYIYEAGKPDPACCEKAVKMLGLPKDKVVVIGDQVFTDILCANRAGLACILVKFVGHETETKLGKRRRVEQAILLTYKMRKKYTNRIFGQNGASSLNRSGSKAELKNTGKSLPEKIKSAADITKKLLKKEILFCDIGPRAYAVSEQKEVIMRHLQDMRSSEKFASRKTKKRLPNVVWSHSSHMIKTGPGIDPVQQQNKAVNIKLASAAFNGIVVMPGETFSFWRTVGKTTAKKGYKNGRVIYGDVMEPGLGGGLCNLGNTVHLLLLHSPMTVTECHTHSDALAPDEGPRVPYSTGTSVGYNYIDLRFRNDTDQPVQLRAWTKGETSYAELRSIREYPWTYKITEEDHHFQKEDDGKYYRVSKIYRETYLRDTGEMVKRELIRDNHSEVMFDPELIPKELIRE